MTCGNEAARADRKDRFEAALPPAPRLEPGRDFEGYAILRELHSGSRSHVYLARDKVDGALVAIKVPATDHAENPAEMQALLLEEWVARRVANTHILKAATQRGGAGPCLCGHRICRGPHAGPMDA